MGKRKAVEFLEIPAVGDFHSVFELSKTFTSIPHCLETFRFLRSENKIKVVLFRGYLVIVLISFLRNFHTDFLSCLLRHRLQKKMYTIVLLLIWRLVVTTITS